MESLGEHLKRERELRGVTIEEIAHITRISTRFLHAIENNDFGSLPDVFVKGFLRAYSKCVGLDPNEIISIYENIKTREKKTDIKEEEKPLPYIADKAKISKLIPFIVITVLILAMAGGFAYKFASKRATETTANKVIEAETKTAIPLQKNSLSMEEQKPAPPGSNQETEDFSAENPPSPLQSESNLDSAIQTLSGNKTQESFDIKIDEDSIKKREDTSTQEVVSKEPSAQIKRKPLTLSINATETVWLQVVIDDSEIKEATLKAGEKFFIKAREKISLTTGNIKGTEAALNGVKLSLPSTRSNVLRDYIITRDND